MEIYNYYGTKIHSISNTGTYNSHSMTFYGFSKIFPVGGTEEKRVG
jgi:hypothetical protein